MTWSDTAMRNIELKARLRDIGRAVALCQELGADFRGELRQTDVYFAVPTGRLKLRISEPKDDYLVFYRRPDVAGPKGCDYVIAPADRAVETVLAESLGVLGRVVKHRALYLWENVRIHLDRVDRLGHFLEFEAVLGAGNAEEDGHAKVARLQAFFGIRADDLLETSYLEMMLGTGRRGPRVSE